MPRLSLDLARKLRRIEPSLENFGRSYGVSENPLTIRKHNVPRKIFTKLVNMAKIYGTVYFFSGDSCSLCHFWLCWCSVWWKRAAGYGFRYNFWILFCVPCMFQKSMGDDFELLARSRNRWILKPSQQQLSVAVYLRSLRIRAAEEKNTPRPSRELMSCK